MHFFIDEAMTDDLSIEQRILIMMRKTLANVVKDTTPQPGLRHPLKDSTIKDIRDCFALISAREQSLQQSSSSQSSKMRPRFADEPRTEQVVPLAKIKKSHSKTKS